MSISKKTIQTEEDKHPAQPHFQEILSNKFKNWTKIEDTDLDEALKDLCGDSFFEMRKMTAQICRAVEGQDLDVKLTEKLIVELKLVIDDTWRCIIDKQKIGIDKLGIIIRKYVKED